MSTMLRKEETASDTYFSSKAGCRTNQATLQRSKEAKELASHEEKENQV
jgi:hypothetical protein